MRTNRVIRHLALFKVFLQAFADTIGLHISVSHLPPGTMKRSSNSLGTPAPKSLCGGAALDTQSYKVGLKFTKQTMNSLEIGLFMLPRLLSVFFVYTRLLHRIITSYGTRLDNWGHATREPPWRSAGCSVAYPKLLCRCQVLQPTHNRLNRVALLHHRPPQNAPTAAITQTDDQFQVDQ